MPYSLAIQSKRDMYMVYLAAAKAARACVTNSVFSIQSKKRHECDIPKTQM
jgi:hypothetical protein